LRDYGLATWEGGDAECDHEGDGRYYTEQTAATSSAGAFSEAGEANADRLKKGRWREAGTCIKCGAVRRDSGIGLEKTPEEYVENIVEVFREVKRVLRDDGTLWLNLGDSYTSGGRQTRDPGKSKIHPALENWQGGRPGNPAGLKDKDLVGIPWRVAFALQADGWYLRSDIIWAKPNPMPESVTDRPTKSHEYLFLMSKRPRYYYDAQAIAEPAQKWSGSAAVFERDNEGPLVPGQAHKQHRQSRKTKIPGGWDRGNGSHGTIHREGRTSAEYQDSPIAPTRNRRDVWTIPTSPYKGAHFATFPPKLVEPCVLAGTSAKGVCPECGAPWERVVERGELVADADARIEQWDRGKNDDVLGDAQAGGRAAALRDAGFVPNHRHTTTTTGWRPTCDHGGEPVPGVVLDPFCGSGTVGQVCRENGRRFVGLDLSWKYLHELAYARAELGQLALA